MSDWVTLPLSALADIRVSNVDKKSLPGEKPVLLCNYMDAYANDYIRSNISFMEATASAAEIARFKVDAGDIVVTKDSETPDDIGIPAVVTEKVENLVCGYHLALLKTRKELVDPVYLCKQLGSHEAAIYFGQRAAGSTRYGLSNAALANVPVSMPELPKQKKIAAVLIGIDTAIEKTEALIAKYQQIKAGLMHDLFTRGLLPNGQLRPPREQAPELYQEAMIGWIPREWRVKRLDEVAQVARGKFTHRPRNDPAYYGGNYPFIQTGDVSAAEGGFLSVHSQTLSALGTTVSQCFPEGTIAITIAANIADTAILAVPMYFPDSVVGAVVQQGVNVRFVELCIRRAKRRLDAMATQSAQKNINLQDLRPLLIPYPESGEQDRIADLFTAIQSKLDSEVSTREKLRAIKRGLMHDLLTGKVPFKVEEPEVVDG